jgi:hypothetical protein
VTPADRPTPGWPRRLGEFAFALAFYGAAFLVYTWPWASHFSSALWCDSGDGLQNVWNLWWVRTALVQEHTSPWFTSFLHYPHGTSVLGHTLNAWNGIVAVPLIPVMGLARTHNLIVAAAFAATGAFMALLARHVSGSAVGALVAGFAFTFSGYHWAHAQGHLQLVSLQFVPLFLLCFIRLLENPGAGRGVLAGLALALVLLCDHYYFFYCGLTVCLWLLMAAAGWVPSVRLGRRHAPGFLAFGLTAAVVAGPLVLGLLRVQRTDPWIGAHDVRSSSADPLALIVPGAHWVFGNSTRGFWERVGDPNEHSIHLGLATWVLAAIAMAAGRSERKHLRCWVVTGVAFFALALGPALRVTGVVLTPEILPYRWLEWLIPPLRLSGVPVRMMVMVTLVASVLAAVGWSRAVESPAAGRGRRAALGVLLAATLVVDLWPSPRPLTSTEAPAWAVALRERPARGGVLVDLPVGYGQSLYAQTVFEKPMAGGFVARTPTSVHRATAGVLGLFAERRYRRLRQIGFGHLVTERNVEAPVWREVWTDGRVRIYEGQDPARSLPP